jgi:hypothetical protein
VVLRSRRGTQMAPAFPEIVAGAAQLPDATALDGELIVWNTAGRLAFEQLQNPLPRHEPAALQAAGQRPTHFVAFDVLRLAGTTTLAWPYARRRAAPLPTAIQTIRQKPLATTGVGVLESCPLGIVTRTDKVGNRQLRSAPLHSCRRDNVTGPGFRVRVSPASRGLR